LGMAYGGEKSPEIVKGVAKAPGKVLEAAGKAADKIQDLKPEWLTKRDPTPEPQHGAPVRVETPLDSASISKSLGGKNLSNDAVKNAAKPRRGKDTSWQYTQDASAGVRRAGSEPNF